MEKEEEEEYKNILVVVSFCRELLLFDLYIRLEVLLWYMWIVIREYFIFLDNYMWLLIGVYCLGGLFLEGIVVLLI